MWSPFKVAVLTKMAYLANIRHLLSKNSNDMAKGQCLSNFQKLSKFNKNSKWKIRQFEISSGNFDDILIMNR